MANVLTGNDFVVDVLDWTGNDPNIIVTNIATLAGIMEINLILLCAEQNNNIKNNASIHKTNNIMRPVPTVAIFKYDK